MRFARGVVVGFGACALACGVARAAVSVPPFAAPDDLAIFAPEVARTVGGMLARAGVDVAPEGTPVAGRIEPLADDRVRLRAALAGRSAEVEGPLEEIDHLAETLGARLAPLAPAAHRRARLAVSGRAAGERAAARAAAAPASATGAASPIAPPLPSPTAALPVPDRSRPATAAPSIEVAAPSTVEARVAAAAPIAIAPALAPAATPAPALPEAAVAAPAAASAAPAAPIAPSAPSVAVAAPAGAAEAPEPTTTDPGQPTTFRPEPAPSSPFGYFRRRIPRVFGVRAVGRVLLHGVRLPDGCGAGEPATRGARDVLERRAYLQTLTGGCGIVHPSQARIEAAQAGVGAVVMATLEAVRFDAAGANLVPAGRLRVVVARDGAVVLDRTLDVQGHPLPLADGWRASYDLAAEGFARLAPELQRLSAEP